MKYKLPVIFILIMFVVVSIFLCLDIVTNIFDTSNDGLDNTTSINLQESDISISKNFSGSLSSRIILVNKVDGAEYYILNIYSSTDLENPINVITNRASTSPGDTVGFPLLDSKYEEYKIINCVITAYSSDKKVASNTFEYIIDYNEEEVIIDDNLDSGKIDGVDDDSYYYVKGQDYISLSKSNTSKDYAILLNTTSDVVNVYAPGLTVDNYEYFSDKKLLVLKNSYVRSFYVGSTFKLELVYENMSTYSLMINVTNGYPYSLSASKLTYDKGSKVNPTITVNNDNSKSTDIVRATIDGIAYNAGTNSFYVLNEKKVVLQYKFLEDLSVGDHEVKFYFKTNNVELGYSILKVTIQDDNQMPYNVSIDFDDSYPNIYITWDSSIDYDKATIKIANNIYSSDDANFADLFEGNSFNAKEKIRDKDTIVSVTVVKDGITYCSTDNAVLPYNLTNNLIIESLTNTYDYIGTTYNAFISNEEELNIYTAYNILNYSDSDEFRMVGTDIVETYKIYAPYLVSSTDRDVNQIAKLIKSSYTCFVEPVRAEVLVDSIVLTGNQVTYSVAQKSGATRSYTRYDTRYESETKQYIEYPYSELHYYYKGESERTSSYLFAIDKVEESVVVNNSVELYLALEKGIKPITVDGTEVDRLYKQIRSVMLEIVDDRMDDYEKVLAIYDWIAYNTIYDRGLTKLLSNYDTSSNEYISLFKNSSFFAEGVFFYGIAQCNGLASAFSIMANMEGIQAIKTMGKVSSGNHSWVKVKLDNEWYVCDVTWSGAKDVTDKNQYYEYITYDYFLMSDTVASSYENRTEFTYGEAYKYYAGGKYNYWASQFFTYQGVKYDYVINNIEEFIALIGYYTQSDSNAILQQGETIQFSIYLNYATVAKWLTEIEYNEALFEISSFARSNSTSGTAISNYKQITYIRVRARK